MESKKNIPRIEPFNPLDKRNLGATVADELHQQELRSFPLSPFIGAGIYALYYCGNFQVYREMGDFNKNINCIWPIYVGKAVPAGARKGGFGLESDPGQVLFKRLSEHAKSIGVISNLDIDDFLCRFLVVDDIWIPLGENLLIESFSPIWNILVDGFGNHNPGKGRYKQKKSSWDILHPGRPWAKNLQNSNFPINDLKASIEEKLKSTKPFK